MFGSIFA